MKLKFFVVLPLTAMILSGCPNPISQPTPVQIATTGQPAINVIGSTHREVGSETEEVIEQNNCGGSNDVSQTIKRSRAIERTLDLGTQLTVDANGQVGLLGTNVGLGTSIANSLGYSYGSLETIERTTTLQAMPGKHISHTISLQEIWDVWEVQVVVASQSITLRFRFRSDFAVNLIGSEDMGCPTNTPQAIITPTSTVAAISPSAPALTVIGPAFTEGTYLIGGEQTSDFSPGDELVVYDEVVGNEIAIALLKVIVRNPDSLTAQEILVHPNRDVRPQQRVDNNLLFLSESELLPAAEYAVGYILREGRVRLRQNSNVQVDSILEALAFEVEGETQLDALPFEPPIYMRVTRLGFTGNIAQVELIDGQWPMAGTIVVIASSSSSAATSTPEPQTFTRTKINIDEPGAVYEVGLKSPID